MDIKKKLKVSVIISNYNKSLFIKKCLDSLKNQTYKKFEIILCDDKSNDNSLLIARQFQKIKIISNKKKTKYPAINQISCLYECFNVSSGDIIFFLDSDDYFHKDKIKKIVNYFLNNSKLHFIQDNFFYEKNNFFYKNKNSNNSFFSIWPKIFPTSTMSFRRQYLKLIFNRIFRNDFKYLEIDARVTIFDYFNFKKKIILNKYLTYYSYDPNGIMANSYLFSKIWWKRRYDANIFIRKILTNVSFKKKIFYIEYNVFSLFHKINNTYLKFINKI